MESRIPTRKPTPERLGAFSDGVLAIIITIMVLELKVPHTASPGALMDLWPTFLSYALSYLFVGIFWMNHHHLLHHTEQAEPMVMWTNLFWIALVSYALAIPAAYVYPAISPIIIAGVAVLYFVPDALRRN